MKTASNIQAPPGGSGASGHEHIQEQVGQDGTNTGKTAGNKDELLKAHRATGKQSPVAEPGELNTSGEGNKGDELCRPSDAAGGLEEVFGYDRVVPIGGKLHPKPSNKILPAPREAAKYKGKQEIRDQTRKLLSEPPIVFSDSRNRTTLDHASAYIDPPKSATSLGQKGIAAEMGIIHQPNAMDFVRDYGRLGISTNFVARAFTKENLNAIHKVECSGSVKPKHLENIPLFQDIADGPLPQGQKRSLTIEEMRTRVEKKALQLERRFERLAEVDRQCTELGTSFVDFSRPDPWDWWRKAVLLEGEMEVIALPLTGAVGMPSAKNPSTEMFGKGCMMLTKTPMKPVQEGKKLVVFKNKVDSSTIRSQSAIEIREIDNSTGMLVFGEDDKVEARDGQYFGADKAGYDGFTWRLHFILQRDTAAVNAKESYERINEMERKAGVEFDCGNEKAQMEYFSRRGTSIVSAVIEGAEDNLFHVFLDAEDHSSMKLTLDAEEHVAERPNCRSWCCQMFIKYGIWPLTGFILFIIGCSVLSQDGEDGNAAGGSILIVSGILCIIFFISYLFRGYCLTSGARKTTTKVTWSASTIFTGKSDEILATTEEQERLNVMCDLHPARDAFLDTELNEQGVEIFENDEEEPPRAGRELSASSSRRCHMLQMTYRDKRSGKIIDCKAVVDPNVSIERIEEALSFLSSLAENADKTKCLGATLHQPTSDWQSMRTQASLGAASSRHIGSDVTNSALGGSFSWDRADSASI